MTATYISWKKHQR